MSTTIQIADKPTLDTVASNISSIKSTLSTVNSNVSTINSNVSSVESTLSTVNTNVTNIYDDVRTMSLQTDTIHANTGNILYNRTKGTKLNWRTISFDKGSMATTVDSRTGKILGIFAKNNEVSGSGRWHLKAGLQIIHDVVRASFISNYYVVSESSYSTDLAPLFMCNDLFDYFTKISLLGSGKDNVSTLFLPDNNYIPICSSELYGISGYGGYILLSDENQKTGYIDSLSNSYVCAIGDPISKYNSVILRKGDLNVSHTFFMLEEAPE